MSHNLTLWIGANVVSVLTTSLTLGWSVEWWRSTRRVLPMPEYQALVGPASECGQVGTRWAAFAVAFSALAAQMTGKSVDFQIQTSAHANVYMDEPRLPIGYAVGRFTLAVQPC